MERENLGERRRRRRRRRARARASEQTSRVSEGASERATSWRSAHLADDQSAAAAAASARMSIVSRCSSPLSPLLAASAASAATAAATRRLDVCERDRASSCVIGRCFFAPARLASCSRAHARTRCARTHAMRAGEPASTQTRRVLADEAQTLRVLRCAVFFVVADDDKDEMNDRFLQDFFR